MVTAESYEVLRFIEHGGKCRTIMDCADGRLLIQRLKDPKGITKELVFKWFKMTAGEAVKYEKCREGQAYRYLNPYSILVTKEEEILLLDLGAKSNESVLKNMRDPKVQKYFVDPVIRIKEDAGSSAALYSLGKTIQLILAHTEAYISLTRREEYLLSGIIGKCLGVNPKKRYGNLKQIQKELSNITCKQEKKQQRKTILIIAVIVIIFAGICGGRAVAESRKTMTGVQAAVGNREAAVQLAEQE